MTPEDHTGTAPAAATALSDDTGPLLRRSRRVTWRHLFTHGLRPRKGYRSLRLLRDPVGHKNLATHGYHVTDVILDAATIRSLIDTCNAWLDLRPPPADGSFHSSYEPAPTAAGALAREQVIDLLLPHLETLTTERARLRPSVLQCKPPSPISGVRAHQDAFLLDEDETYGLFAWVALTDITLHDGPLIVLPGSHRYATWTRASMVTDNLGGLHGAIEGNARALELQAGQVVWFDNAMIHGSLPNLGPAMRLGVSAVVAPSGVQLSYPRASEGEPAATARIYELDPVVAAGRTQPKLEDDALLGVVALDRLAFGPRALDLVSRLHRLLHRGAPGVRLPEGAACTTH